MHSHFKHCGAWSRAGRASLEPVSAAAPIKGCQRLPAGSVAGGVWSAAHIWRLFDTKACNRPNHFSFAPTAPTLAGASRCHRHIIHAAHLGSPSHDLCQALRFRSTAKTSFMLARRSRGRPVSQELNHARTPSVTEQSSWQKRAEADHLRLILTAQLASSTRCNVTVPVTPDYLDHAAEKNQQS